MFFIRAIRVIRAPFIYIQFLPCRAARIVVQRVG